MPSETAMPSFWSSSFFRGETALELPGPGCEPITDDFEYEHLIGIAAMQLLERFVMIVHNLDTCNYSANIQPIAYSRMTRAFLQLH